MLRVADAHRDQAIVLPLSPYLISRESMNDYGATLGVGPLANRECVERLLRAGRRLRFAFGLYKRKAFILDETALLLHVTTPFLLTHINKVKLYVDWAALQCET